MKTLYYSTGAIVIIAFIGIIASLFMSLMPSESDGQGLTGGVNASDCTVTSSAAVVVGPGGSAVVLAAHGRRAWAEVEQQVSATNTVALNFGADATLTSGMRLAPGTASTTPDKLIFGLNTDMPYTGDVTGITNVASTTVIVTECRY